MTLESTTTLEAPAIPPLLPAPCYTANLYHSQDGIRIFCGDNRIIAPQLGQYDVLHTDPPYGIGADNRKRILSRGKLAKPIDYGESQRFEDE